MIVKWIRCWRCVTMWKHIRKSLYLYWLCTFDRILKTFNLLQLKLHKCVVQFATSYMQTYAYA